MVQVVLRVTPRCEGELDVLGLIFHLCVDPSQSGRGSESPGPPGRAGLPCVSSGKDSVYQRQQNWRVPNSLTEGVQVCPLTAFFIHVYVIVTYKCTVYS